MAIRRSSCWHFGTLPKPKAGFDCLFRHSRLNRENLYRMLSKSGNPSLSSLDSVLHSLGLRLAVAVK